MGAGSYLIRRLLLLIPTLFGLSLLTFAISHVVPADPAKLAAGPRASNEMVETIRRQFGLDRPLPEQYVTYVGGLLRGNFGDSITTRRSVGEDLKERFPATFELVLFAMILAVGAGIPLGVVAAVNQNHWPDQFSRLFAISSVSIPQFWFGLVLQLFFASSLGLAAIEPPLADPRAAAGTRHRALEHRQPPCRSDRYVLARYQTPGTTGVCALSWIDGDHHAHIAR